MKKLILIPARAGSKGLPGKNTKELNGKPLIAYSIEFALKIANEGDRICISSNDETVFEIAKQYNVEIPFVRPENLSTDQAGSYEVIMHALDHYKSKNILFDSVLLLQPTSPVRKVNEYQQMEEKYSPEIDMVVTVKRAKENPYFTLFEENANGILEKSKPSNFTRRQDCPVVYAMNGSMYLMNVSSLYKSNIQGFKKIVKVEVPESSSIDIDTMEDWILAEYIMKKDENN